MIKLAEWDSQFWLNEKRRAARDSILSRMAKGQKFESACRSVGIDSSTGRRWKMRCARFKQETKLAKLLVYMTPRIEKLRREVQYLIDAAGIQTD